MTGRCAVLQRPWIAVWAVLLILGSVGCSSRDEESDRDTLVVAAASSLRELCEATRVQFEQAHPAVKLVFSFGSSSKLARQLAASGTFQVFLSADAVTVRQIASSLDVESIAAFLSNRLTLVAREGLSDPAGSPEELLTASGRIAVAAAPVPAGRYARDLLRRRGLLDRLAPRLVSADNVRIALAMVVSGAVDYGWVYQSDTHAAPAVKVCWTAPKESRHEGSRAVSRVDGEGIRYVAASCVGASPAAREYIRFLLGADVQRAAEQLGFERAP